VERANIHQGLSCQKKNFFVDLCYVTNIEMAKFVLAYFYKFQVGINLMVRQIRNM